ncbi:lipopolysaccharide heptosyltransferase I [Nitrosophilus alvini]|uniref:lipopolysaccharide heptosyltransferase I n=1 Tax=Nitrosophilus alvini TaxID=2714855 RepID=UPI00190AE8DA|nr:lipopolysaccharide heptosyltransferase I [Nitrosophilus alvini]
MNIAIVRLSALGDIVHSMIVLQFIKRHFPNSNITWITDKRFEEILKHNPHLDRVASVDIKNMKNNFSLKLLKNSVSYLKNLGSFDMVLDIQGLIKSALIAKFLGKKRYGLEIGCIRENLASFLYTNKIIVPCENNVIDRNMGFVSKALGFEYTKNEIDKKEPYLFFDPKKEYKHIDCLLEKKRKNILLIAGSSRENKNYPADKFANVAKALNENILLLWGNEEEKRKAEQIALKSNAKVLPKLSLNDLKYLISKTDLVIGGDTGPTHIAWAMNKPSVVIFGYTPTTLMYQTPINIAVKSNSKPDLCRFDKKDDSIKNIKEAQIIEKAKELL